VCPRQRCHFLALLRAQLAIRWRIRASS
jgi:hypothetical protein